MRSIKSNTEGEYMAVVLELKHSDYYRIFWLKYVDDVDLSQHCMKSLIGVKSTKVSPRFRKGVITLDESNSEYFYLCGVVYPWSWKDNFHCAFRKAEGKEFTYTFRHTEVHIYNAEQIEISPKWIDIWNLFAKNKLYSTCRNWQFANWFAKNCQPKKEETNKSGLGTQLDLF